MDWGKLIVDSVFASIVGTAIASLTTIIVNAISHSSHLKEIKDAGNKAVQNTNELKEENIKEHTLLHADHEKTDLLITSQTREIIANLSKAEESVDALSSGFFKEIQERNNRYSHLTYSQKEMADSIEKLSAFGEQMKALHYENIQLTQLLLEREREITVLKQKTKELQKELDRYITHEIGHDSLSL